MKCLIIVNDPPYGSERPYNSLRLAHALINHEAQVSVFLMADAVLAAKSGQGTPDGYYNMERMLKRVVARGKVLLCGTCMDARAIRDDELIAGAERGTMDMLAQLTADSDKVLVY